MRRTLTASAFALALFTGVGGVALWANDADRDSALRVEKKARYISAGRGEKPFDVTRHLIHLNEILTGGPPRNGIPSLDNPAFISAAKADGILKSSDIVVGLEFGGVAKAYPIRILNWHEIVNDQVGNQPVMVSWCPLCGSSVVYDPQLDGEKLRFLVSGLLYQRNLLFYDVETDSLWAQLLGQAVTGASAGKKLTVLPAVHVTWAQWKKMHPRTTVLSFRTGHQRDYSRDPYGSWALDRRQALIIPATGKGPAHIYPFSQLRKAGNRVTEIIAGEQVVIEYDPQRQTAQAKGADGRPVGSFISFLGNARAFYPHAKIYKARRR